MSEVGSVLTRLDLVCVTRCCVHACVGSLTRDPGAVGTTLLAAASARSQSKANAGAGGAAAGDDNQDLTIFVSEQRCDGLVGVV